ncbi:DUF3093 domain-containing protein [Glaciihabitans arcticus]|uniref:DUF3093 domain-containing protein n=1 Tax=Glaciihabitans arcticus TaxID=2668039 RepID=A0A4Q9GQF7_9MICO|nr:DUF3093 domain-containing protein [Glaciihabitans arcticus]TBN56825.1 DUF3093 domain-containing protein [Glaciihabitans arcticus]
MTTYRERLWPAPWLFLATALVLPATLLVFVPINFTVGVVVAVVFYVGICLAMVLSAPSVEVTETHFIAGRARLPLTAAGEAVAFEGAEATLERGQRLDARAWLVLRGWIAPVVRVEVTDPEDPAPYWLVSSRHPDKIVEALASYRNAATN